MSQANAMKALLAKAQGQALPPKAHTPASSSEAVDVVFTENQNGSGAAAAALTIAAFYNMVLPSTGAYCLMAPNKRHYWFDTIAEITEFTAARTKTEADWYFATNSFDGSGSRKAERAIAGRSLRLDIDAGPAKVAKHGLDKVYPDAQAAAAHLLAFTKWFGLKPTMVIASGAGLHIYYCFAVDFPSISEWSTAAGMLHKMTASFGLKTDAPITTDPARVLRPLGSLHNNGAHVALAGTIRPFLELADFSAACKAKLSGMPVDVPQKARNINADLDAPPAIYAPCSVVSAATKCGWLKEMLDAQGGVGYEDWINTLAIMKHSSEGEEYAVQWSRGAPTSDDGETLKKLDSLTHGPTSCAKIASKHCANCVHNSKVKSPLLLGRLSLSPPLQSDDDQKPKPWGPIEEVNRDTFIAVENGEAKIFVECVNEMGHDSVVNVSSKSLGIKLANKFVQIPQSDGSSKKIGLYTAWITSPNRREYGGIGFYFSGSGSNEKYNLWRGYGVESNSGSARPVLRHLWECVGRDRRVYRYVLCWMATCIQFPGDRTETVIAWRGPEGVGKGTIARLMTETFGQHALHISHARHLTGNFNAHLRTGLFAFVDEGYWAGDKAAEGVLKQLVTEPQIAIERKGQDVFMALNRLKIMMASNNDWIVPAGPEGRRFVVIDVPATMQKNWAYWDRLNKWLDQGGRGIFLHCMQTIKLDKFNIREIPNTKALEDQKMFSLPPFLRWLHGRLHEGELVAGIEWSTAAHCKAVTQQYTEYCSARGLRHEPCDSQAVARNLQKVFGSATRLRDGTGARHWYWAVPEIHEARRLFCQRTGIGNADWPVD